MKKTIFFFFALFFLHSIIIHAKNGDVKIEEPSFFAAPNDDCSQATSLTVNTGYECVTSFTSNFQGATASGLPNTCGGVPNDDVWFEFTAISSVQVVTISNVVGTVPVISGAIYSGSCNNLIQISCLSSTGSGKKRVDNLVVGETYRIRLFSMVSQINTVSSFDICITTLSPPISVSVNNTNEQLLSNLIKNSDCLEVFNFQTKSGKDYIEYPQYPVNAVEGIGIFEKNNSLFPFDKGLVLSTGDALSAPGPKTVQDQSSGSTFWTGDTDLNNLLTTLNIGGATLHASSIEFDFISSTDYFGLDYLFASDEYGNRCDNYDLVAFFLTNTNTGVTTNIAVIPNTNTIVSAVTIKDGQYQQFPINCISQNAEYFQSYYNGTSPESENAPVNFRGITVPMKATASVVPNQTYHLKIVVAEQKNNFSAGPGGVIYYDPYDSAVFIANLSSIPDELNLGPDYLIETQTALCYGDSLNLNSNLSNQSYTFKWFRNDYLITGANQSFFNVTESGIYRLEAYYSTSCFISDEIKIEYYPKAYSGAPIPNLRTCVFESEISPFNLEVNKQFIKSELLIDVNEVEISFYETENDALQSDNSIQDITNYIPNSLPQTIYVLIVYKNTACKLILHFDLIASEVTQPVSLDDIKICTQYILPPLPQEQFYSTQDYGNGEILNSGKILTAGLHIFYVNAKNIDGCISSVQQSVEVLNCSIQKGISPNGDGLNDAFDLTDYYPLQVTIFNRYGKQVYHHGNGYNKQWIGQDSSGKLLPEGTYFYKIITVSEEILGYVYLRRELK